MTRLSLIWRALLPGVVMAPLPHCGNKKEGPLPGKVQPPAATARHAALQEDLHARPSAAAPIRPSARLPLQSTIERVSEQGISLNVWLRRNHPARQVQGNYA